MLSYLPDQDFSRDFVAKVFRSPSHHMMRLLFVVAFLCVIAGTAPGAVKGTSKCTVIDAVSEPSFLLLLESFPRMDAS